MNLPTESQALDLIEKYSTSTKEHLFQVGEIMKYFWEKLWEDAHYCWHGNRSQTARDFMRDQGFEYAKDLAWGIDAWKHAGEEIIK